MATRLFFLISFLSIAASAQNLPGGNKVDLGDVQIKGELNADKGLNLSSREKNYLSDQIKLRTSFKEDILEELPPYFKTPEANP